LISIFEVGRPFPLASTRRAVSGVFDAGESARGIYITPCIQGISEYAEGVPSWSITDHAGSLGNLHADVAKRPGERTTRRMTVTAPATTRSPAHALSSLQGG